MSANERIPIERLTDVLTRVAAGDFTARIERDSRGDAIDVLASLVNNMIIELSALVAAQERRAVADRVQLEELVAVRTRELRESEENFRQLFDAAPVPMLLVNVNDSIVRFCNERAADLLQTSVDHIVGRLVPDLIDNAEDRRAFFDGLQSSGKIDALAVRLSTGRGRTVWSLVSARSLVVGGQPSLTVAFTDLTEQKRIEDRLRELATTDSLTGTLNRRRFFEVAEEEISRVVRYARPLCIAMLDLDHFKAVNDRFGHAVGDEALRLVGAAVRGQLRRQDQVGRYGGEEFVVVLPETTIEAAAQVLERVRVQIDGLQLMAEGQHVEVTVSAGLVAFRPGESLGDCVRRADDALYAAKAEGRNRIQIEP